MSVLIIDDEPEVGNAIERELERVGIAAQATTSGYDGLRVFKSSFVEVIIMDMHMGGLDGADTSREIRKLDSDVAIIALTGFRTDYEEKARGIDIRNWIDKPVIQKPSKRYFIDCIREATLETRFKRLKRRLAPLKSHEAVGGENCRAGLIRGALVALVPESEVAGTRESKPSRLAFMEMISSLMEATAGGDGMIVEFMALLSATIPGIERLVPTLEDEEMPFITRDFRNAYQEFCRISEEAMEDDES